MLYQLKHKEINVTEVTSTNVRELNLHDFPFTNPDGSVTVKILFFSEFGPIEVHIGDFIVDATETSLRQVITKAQLDEFYEPMFIPKWAETPNPQTIYNYENEALEKLSIISGKDLGPQ